MRQYINEMLKRKDLLLYLVKSGLKADNRNSYLGYFWWLLDPLLNVVVYYFLMVIILGRGGENYAVYLVIGLVGWRWINTTISTSAKAITRYSSIINQVYLPKSIFPLATSFTQLFNFGFGLIVILLFLAIYGIIPGWQVIYLPFIIIIQLLFLLAMSMFVAYSCVFIRDIDNILSHILRLVFYASPIIWEGSMLPERFNWIVAINPFAIILDSYRAVLIWQSSPQLLGLFVIGLFSLAAIIVLFYYYSRNEHKIIKAL
ncbi:teichoic acid ABC transporter permease [Anaerobacillus alkalilacustris]|uniref:Transport permease protein n=1 Tax=Anaerobacillus alkalilacustris TaxID=393763 RepID=A0A1S2LHB6_9BACI|nr:ABC transporter permease [Anaerobacillus alkalilacustris]OIJ11704.1 teichoic acid ABC transporter permease [Anaerobacillus alkalilacustris]